MKADLRSSAASISSNFLLERQLHAELNRARIADRADRSERAAKVLDRQTRDTPEVRLVENVENLTTKLQFPGFTKAEVLERREVHALGRRPRDRAATRIPDDILNSSSGSRIDLET